MSRSSHRTAVAVTPARHKALNPEMMLWGIGVAVSKTWEILRRNGYIGCIDIESYISVTYMWYINIILV